MFNPAIDPEINSAIKADLDSVKGNMDQLRSDFARLRSDLGTVARDVLTVGQCEVGEAKNKLGSMAQTQMDRVAKTAASTRMKGKQAVDMVGNRIESHPFTSILAAVGAGFAIGMIAHNRVTR